MRPVISIIIPCFNQGHYLSEALESVAQFKDESIYEIIIVNDGSTDFVTLTILKELEAKGSKIINQSNKGLGAARNSGIKAAAGKYILPLDCDNKIRPEYISESIAIMESDEGVAVVYGDAEYFGRSTGKWEVGEFNLQRLMIYNYIDACAVFRKYAWEKAGGYDENMPVMGFEDWDLWLKIAFQNGKFRYIKKILFCYRRSANSMLSSVTKEKFSIVIDYLERKHSTYLNRKYLNEYIQSKASSDKKAIISLTLKTFFPRVSNLFRNAGIMKKKDII